jgi:phage terminase large subunit-like protein
VQEVRYDPWQMQAVAQRLAANRVPMVEFPQSSPRLTEASQNLFEVIKCNNLTAYADADIRLALQRSVAIETARGWRIAKEKQSHKIDVVIALAMAALGTVANQTDPLAVWDRLGKVLPDRSTMRAWPQSAILYQQGWYRR